MDVTKDIAKKKILDGKEIKQTNTKQKKRKRKTVFTCVGDKHNVIVKIFFFFLFFVFMFFVFVFFFSSRIISHKTDVHFLLSQEDHFCPLSPAVARLRGRQFDVM